MLFQNKNAIQLRDHAIINKIIPIGGNTIPNTHNIVASGPQSPLFLSGYILMRISSLLKISLTHKA